MESPSEPQILEYRRFHDSRGSLLKPGAFIEYGGEFKIHDLYVSKSTSGVFRGFHMQIGRFAQSKFVAPLVGVIIDFVVDLREGSPTFGSIQRFELSAESNVGVYVPRGFGHGFYSTTDSMVLNLSDAPYSPENETGINPLSFRQIQLMENLVISDKDKSLPLLEFET